jgi:DNA-binding SARP family transcriptional activator/nucleoid-associated protein YgaU
VTNRALGRVKGLLALTAVLATLAAPPIALLEFVGNPLPASVPAWRDIVDGLTRNGISDRTVIEVLAVLGWIVWAQLAIALIAETVAVARGRQVTRLPLLPGAQPLAARWLAAAALLLAPLATSPSAAATKPALLTVASPDRGALAAQVVETPPSGNGSNEDPGVSSVVASPEQRLADYVVQRHDSFWDIAERFIGDPFRWREIRDLNIGRPQPNGETVEAGSDLVRPGWRLVVPAGEQDPRPIETPALSGEWTVDHGDHLWEVADTVLSAHLGRAASDDEVRPYWQSLIDLNRDVLVDQGNPSLVFAGQVLRLPPPPGSAQPSPVAEAPPPPPSPVPAEPDEQEPVAPTRGPDVVSTTTPSTSATPTTEATDLGQADRAATDDGEAGAMAPSTGLLGVAGAGIAVGIAETVRRRRQQRLARAPAGFAPPPMPDELGALRTEVALGADVDASEDLRRATSAVAAHVAATRGLGRRRARLVQVCPDRVEVLLDEPALPAPPNWDPEASGAVWSCSRPVPTVNGSGACPALVTIGSDDANVVVLDLESAGVLTIGSDDPARAQALVRSMILELAHSPLAESVALVVVGDDVEHLESDRVRRVDRWDDVAQDALSWARQSLQVLAAHRLSTAFAARGTDRALDGIASMVIVCSEPPASESFEVFAALAHEGAAACAVVVGDDSITGATHLRVHGEVIDIPALGLACRAQGICPGAVDQVGELLTAADQPPEPMTLFDERDVIQLDHSSGAYEDPPSDVFVRVLGEIRVIGGHKPLTPKQTGMLTFVALHDPCSVDRIEDAIWPTPMDTRRQQVHNTASRIRSALGADHLPASADSEYRVGPRVRTDLDLLRRRATYAATQPPERAIETLRGALEFVEGPAFTYRSADRASFVWVDKEHWTSDTEARVVEVAWRMWNFCTDQGDTEGAIWAARQGLLASPGNTELTEALMRAYITAGDRAAAEDVFVSHAKALDELDQDDPAPSTLQLWEDLREGREPSPT